MRNEPLRPVPKPGGDAATRGRRNKRSGTYAERKVASDLGGKRVPLSGAGEVKGDVRVEDLPTPLFVEVKHIGERSGRGDSSITIDREWIEKTIADADACGALPVVVTHFRDGGTFYLTSGEVFEALVEQLRLYYARALGASPATFEECIEQLHRLWHKEHPTNG